MNAAAARCGHDGHARMKKGPASVGALPDHGSTHINGHMDMNTHVNTTAATISASASLYALIAEYWLAYDFLMTLESREDEDEEAACTQLLAAEIAVCGYLPVSNTEARIKADFLNTLASGNNGYLEPKHLDALLKTMPTLFAREVAA